MSDDTTTKKTLIDLKIFWWKLKLICASYFWDDEIQSLMTGLYLLSVMSSLSRKKSSQRLTIYQDGTSDLNFKVRFESCSLIKDRNGGTSHHSGINEGGGV